MDNDIAKETNEPGTAEKTANTTKVTLTKTAVIVLGILLGLVAVNAIVSFVTSIIS